jgi:hypothetical protein
MHSLRTHERLAIEMLLAGQHDTLARLRNQASRVSVSKRTYSAAGEYIDLAVPNDVELATPTDIILQDIELEFEGVKDGAAILLYVENGKLSFIEFATYGVEWPENPMVVGAHYLREVETQPGTYFYEPVQIRDLPTLERALLGRRSTSAA